MELSEEPVKDYLALYRFKGDVSNDDVKKLEGKLVTGASTTLSRMYSSSLGR